MVNFNLVANYIAKVETELDYILLDGSLNSTRASCNRIVLIYAPGNDLPTPDRIIKLVQSYGIEHFERHRGPVSSFSEIRNKALNYIKEGEFFYWIDADEIGFPTYFQLLKLRAISILSSGVPLTSIRTRFIHFCLSPLYYERTEPRTTIIQKGPETRWEGSVHERIVGIPKGIELNSDYFVHHYGYCKPQAEVFKHWKHYAELEGDFNRYLNEEVDGKVVPYFREGERPTFDHILDDRKKILIPYFGAYPDLRVLRYLYEHCPKI